MQGIGSILGLSEEKRRAPGRRGSLRRTLSADMSSRKWLAQMGSPEGKGKPEREETEQPKQLDLWSSIIAQNAGGSSTSTAPGAPYVHPLVRRSASWLSKKSLEVCTESLGSETGSDGFSSSEDFDYSPSDVSEDEEEGTEQEEEVSLPKKELGAVNYNCSAGRRSPPRSFPPPLSSISRRDGPCLQMRPHRKDGRLVLEAVPVTSQTYLHAEREGGRLRLTFVNALIRNQASQPKNVDPHEEEVEEEEMKNDTQDREEQEEEIEDAAYVDRGVDIPRKEAARSREMKVHRAAEMLTKFMGALGKNPDPWKDKKSQEEEGIIPVQCLARSSPAPAMLNTYECRWRTGPFRQLDLPPLMNAEEVLQARRCKEARRPLVVWAPRCIATT